MSDQQTVVGHTPGPWQVGGADQSGIFSTDPRRCLATVFKFKAPYEANARLIAAAPELLEAVKGANVQRDPRHRISMLVNDWQRILDAIAKAEGRDS